MIMDSERRREHKDLKLQLRKLGYSYFLSEGSMPLVQKLLADFIRSSDQLKTAQFLLEMDNDQSSKECSRSENVRLVRECNMIHQKYYRLKESTESEIKHLKQQIEELTSKNENLQMMNAELNDKLHSLRYDFQELSNKSPQRCSKKAEFSVQERKDGLFVQRRSSSVIQDTNMSNVDEQSFAASKEAFETNADGTNCDNFEERIDEAEKLLDNQRQQNITKDAEINRLQHLLADIGNVSDNNNTGEQFIPSTLSSEMHGLASENIQLKNIIHQLENDLRQRSIAERHNNLRNHSLDVRLSNLTQVMESLNAEKENALQLWKIAKSDVDQLKQTNHCSSIETKNRMKNKSSDASFDTSNCNDEAIRHLRVENEKLLHRVNSLVLHEEKLAQENDRLRGRVENERFEHLKKVKQQLLCIEKDRDYWRDEAMQMQKIVQKQISDLPGRRSNRPPSYVRELEEQKESLLRELNHMRRHVHLDKARSQGKIMDEMIKKRNKTALERLRKENHSLLEEREEMRNHMDRFERHVSEIQGNVKVLTQERDALKKLHDEANNELRRARSSTLHEGMKGSRISVNAQTVIRRLENEKENLVSDLLRMTTERDSLRERLRAITESSIKEKAHLEQSIENLQRKLGISESDTNELSELLRAVRDRADLLDTEHSALKEKLRDAIIFAKEEKHRSTTLEHHITELQTMTEKMNADFSWTEKTTTDLRKQIANISEHNQNLNEHSDALERNLDQEREHISRLQQLIANLESEKSQAITRTRETEAILSEKESQLHDCHLKCEQLNSKLVSHEHKFMEMEMNHQSKIEEVSQQSHERERLKRIVDELKQYVQMGDRDHERLISDLQTLKSANQELQVEFHKATETTITTQRRCDQLEAELCRKHEILKEKEKMVADGQAENSKLLNEIETLQLKINQLERDFSDSQHNLMEREQKLDTELHSHQLLKENYEKLNNLLQNTQLEYEKLKRDSSGLSSQIKQLIEEKEYSLSDLSNLRKIISEMEMSRSAIEHQRHSSVVENQALNEQMRRLEKELLCTTEQLSQEKRNLAMTEGLLSAAREAEASYRLQVDSSLNEVNAMRNRVEDKDMQCQELSLQLARLQSQKMDFDGEVHLLNAELNRLRIENEHIRAQLEGNQRCSHGCYHSSQCSNQMRDGQHNPDACETGCQHSDECRQGWDAAVVNLRTQ